jgi:hypothetical protein
VFVFALVQHGKPSWTMTSHGIVILRYHRPAPSFPLHNHCPPLHPLRVLISSRLPVHNLCKYAIWYATRSPPLCHADKKRKGNVGKEKRCEFRVSLSFSFSLLRRRTQLSVRHTSFLLPLQELTHTEVSSSSSSSPATRFSFRFDNSTTE